MADEAAPGITARQPRAIHSALTVLEAVAARGAGVSAREISLAVGLPRATTYRLLNLLVQDGYLVRTPDLSGFALGAKVAELAGAVMPVRISRAARAVVDDVRAGARGGIHLAVFVDGRVVIADMDPDFPLRDPDRAAREPTSTALGALLVLEAGADIPPGVAVLPGGIVRRVAGTEGCLAAPIRDADGSLAGGIGYSGGRARILAPDGIPALLRDAADRLGPLLT